MRGRRTLPPGSTVGSYKIDDVLGVGGFSVTYAARDTTLDREVALKEYFPERFAWRAEDSSIVPGTGDSGDLYRWGLDRFFQEARQLARFHHPAIVGVFAVFPANQTGYMALEKIEGEPLDRKLARERQLGPAELERLADGLLDALAQLHGSDTLHRDIKPANVMWTPQGRPVLIDFGSARVLLAGETNALTSVLTPGYAPPEQYSRKGDHGPWTDVYAAAATLYHAALGQAPPESIDRQQALTDGMPDPLPPLPATLPPRIARLIESGLRMRASQRPQSIQAWRDGALAAGTEPLPAGTGTPGTVAGETRATPDLFISHSSDDAAAAGELVAMLEAAGLRCWVAPRDVRPGHDYPSEIIKGIQRSAAIVLLLSPKSNASAHVRREVERACSAGKLLLPVRMADIAPSDALAYFAGEAHWIDAFRVGLAETAKRIHATMATTTRLGPRATAPPASVPPVAAPPGTQPGPGPSAPWPALTAPSSRQPASSPPASGPPMSGPATAHAPATTAAPRRAPRGNPLLVAIPVLLLLAAGGAAAWWFRAPLLAMAGLGPPAPRLMADPARLPTPPTPATDSTPTPAPAPTPDRRATPPQPTTDQPPPRPPLPQPVGEVPQPTPTRPSLPDPTPPALPDPVAPNLRAGPVVLPQPDAPTRPGGARQPPRAANVQAPPSASNSASRSTGTRPRPAAQGSGSSASRTRR